MSGWERVLVLLLLAGLLCLGLWPPNGADGRFGNDRIAAMRLGSDRLGWEDGEPHAFARNQISCRGNCDHTPIRR